MAASGAPTGTDQIAVEPADSRRVVTVQGEDGSTVCVRTSYPDDLVRLILQVKGPSHVGDEIGREQDPTHLRAHLLPAVLAHVDPEALAGADVLDFGCGAGASTCILARELPQTRFLGIDLVPGHLDIARARATFHGLSNASFALSADGAALPDGLGSFDMIVLSAVFEHLLPVERTTLMPMLWEHLRPGGVLVIDETPWRWSPVDSHTTALPLINYLPEPLAYAAARWRARHGSPHLTGRNWPDLLRAGIRGATRREIVRSVGPRAQVTVVTPHRLGVDSHVGLFFLGYGGALGRAAGLKRALKRVLLTVERRTGVAAVPYLTLALRKADTAG